MRLVPAGWIPLIVVAAVPLARAGDNPLPAGATARLGDGGNAVGALAVAPDGASVAVARGPAVGLFRLNGAALRTLTGHQKPVQRLVYAPVGEWLVGAAEPGDAAPLRFWDTASGDLLRRWGDAGRTIRDVALSADGQTLVMLEPNAVTLHHARLGRFVGALALPDGVSECHRLAIASDGHTLAVGCERDRMVWDLPARRLIRCSPAAGPCQGLLPLADGRRVIWLDADDLRLWSLPTDDAVAFSAGRYLRDVTAFVLSADARLLAVAQGAEVSVWDVAERRLEQRLDGHKAVVRALAFTPDRRALVAGDDAGEALVWEMSK